MHKKIVKNLYLSFDLGEFSFHGNRGARRPVGLELKEIWLKFFFTQNSVPNHIPPLVETARDRLYVTNLNRFSRTFNIHSVYLGRLVGNTGALKWILLLYDIFAKTPFSLEFFLYMDSQRRKTDVNLIWVGHLEGFSYIYHTCVHNIPNNSDLY